MRLFPTQFTCSPNTLLPQNPRFHEWSVKDGHLLALFASLILVSFLFVIRAVEVVVFEVEAFALSDP